MATKVKSKTHELQQQFEYNGNLFSKRPETQVFFDEMVDAGIIKQSAATRYKKAFERAGLNTFTSFEHITEGKLEAIEGITSVAACTIANHRFIVKTEGQPLTSFDKMLENATQFKYLRTRVDELNNNLNDSINKGFRSGTLIEFYGKPQMGKSQWMYELAVRVMLPKNKGGWDQGVIYFDTEGGFSMSRLVKSALYWGLPEADLRKKFNFVAPQLLFLGTDLFKHLEMLDSVIKEKNVGIIIIDSLIQPFKNQFASVSGEGLASMTVRQSLLGKTLARLKSIARSYNLIACYTNQVIANIGSYGNTKKEIPVGGDTVGHASDLRFELKKQQKQGDMEVRKMTLVDCGWLPVSKSEFALSPIGILDPKELKAYKQKFNQNQKILKKDPTAEIFNHLEEPIEKSQYFKFYDEEKKENEEEFASD